MFTIYALADPQTQVIRYVGQTIHPDHRLQQHQSPAALSPQTHCRAWIHSIQQRGLQPAMVVCDTCDDLATANELERAWIALFRMAGVPLTNHTDGGEGMIGYKPTEQTRGKMRANHRGMRGRHQSDEAKENIRRALQGRQASAEEVEKNRLGHIGKKYSRRSPSEETRQKLRLANLGKVLSEEHKSKISAGLKSRKARA